MGTIVKASGRGLFAVITMFFAKATDCCKRGVLSEIISVATNVSLQLTVKGNI
ncbi:hypothetical protein PR002_g11602 [Phytophthora rubi]|uniref:Uncharacterized protein n=1 Tax=Phytophthora rubi TaxID=129364 RepID=A0A6A3LX70_9STRA|nr:hypothetical protein PR002_g11602 [Phytophthora rubi]